MQLPLRKPTLGRYLSRQSASFISVTRESLQALVAFELPGRFFVTIAASIAGFCVTFPVEIVTRRVMAVNL
ncbi:hypothetical protein K1719_020601 [Acacia pycnantha]|nr:hypothetical protein K1719_020601 [Acacia pycnantha]